MIRNKDTQVKTLPNNLPDSTVDLPTEKMTNHFPNLVSISEFYDKINLTTIKPYKDELAIRPIQNVLVVGRMNNVNVSIP